jgi:hypothetical protein
VKTRLPFEEKPFGGAAQRGAVFFYAVLTVGLAGLALYMGGVLRHPLTSPYVIAPGVGAAWFGLRVFMLLRPKD